MRTRAPVIAPCVSALAQRRASRQSRPEPLSIRQLIEHLDQAGPFPAQETIERGLARVCPTQREIRTYARFDPRTYRRNLVVRRAGYEMLVYCWGPGQQCRIHDLSGALCILAVLKGEALKVRFERGGGGQIRAVSYQPLPTGAVSAAAPDELHIIANWLDPQCGLVTLQVHLSPRAALQTEPAPGVGAVPFEHLRQLAAPHIQQHWLELLRWPRRATGQPTRRGAQAGAEAAAGRMG